MTSPSISRYYYSFPAVIAVAAAAFARIELLPSIGVIGGAPYLLLAALEGVLILQLMAAWKDRFDRLPYTHLYLFLAIFFLRIVFRLTQEPGVLWALRAGSVHTLHLGFIGYVCMAALHPAAYEGIQRLSRRYALWPTFYRYAGFSAFLVCFALACFQFRSYHITRDGFDWIERATLPVWQTYIREPLTIGLYRLFFLLAWERWEITSFQAIGTLSICAGIWWAVWLRLFTEKKWVDGFDRLLTWMLFASSGGMLVLFFAHIEVYPVFIAGLMPAFYFADRYLRGKRSVVFAGIFFSIAFLLHLSAGWLLPAFLLLPWFRNEKNWLGDIGRFLGAFGLIQILFWGCLMAIYYEGSPVLLLERLYEQFHVGPDRAMFLPQWSWFISYHLLDLLNVYLYYSLPCFLLIPVCVMRLPTRINRENGFWIATAGGYFFYTFFWNADRGYPEDWDLFSPITLLIVLLFLQLLLPSAMEKSEQSTYSANRLGGDSPSPSVGSEKHVELMDFADFLRSLIYIAAVGTFVFSCSQVYFHHIIPFIPPQYR